MEPERFFIDHDESFQWYLIPVSHRKEWEHYRHQGQFDDEDPPEQAQAIFCLLEDMTFENPVMKKV